MTFALMGGMVTRYYVNVLHVNAAILATLLLVWNVWDAVNDPMMGALMDKMFAKHRNPKGKFRPWLLRATPLLAITSVVFWTVPTFFEGTAMLVVLFFCKILYEGCYTMFNIPMGSLLSAMANTDEERASLSSARGFGAMVGNMIPTMILPQLLAHYGDSPKAFGLGAAICAGIGFFICLLHYFWTEERNIVEAKPGDSDDIKFTDIFGVFRKNRAFLALCIHGICICTMQYVNSTLGTYMYADVLGDIGMMSYSMLVSMPLTIVVLIVAPKLAKKFGLEGLIRYCPVSYTHLNNLASTLTILDVMRHYGCKNFVFSSSATVYGDPASVPITEDFPVGATTNPYGATKAMNEQILTDCCKADPSLNVALLRYFNPIGAHESGLIGDMYKRQALFSSVRLGD